MKLQASQSQTSRNIMGQILLKAIFRQLKNKMVTENRQKITSDQLAFYDSMNSSMDNGTAADVVYIDFSMPFNAVHGIFIDKMLPQKYSMKWNRFSRRISSLNSLETSRFSLQPEIYGYSPGLPFKRGYQEETLEIYCKS
ncbi:hypothetical protein llap_11800 [Limosa lapponica baueri]|uniref:Uncharacterized protein n=1 Tax=Limosa lapponica baueri TaxID=1758121 RepID=A0A2I0TVQ5_LIMLA|nr:hypothetical protein llap_11800 [Limosa lapponica baueri]